MKHLLTLSIFLFLYALNSEAGEITGRITEANTKDAAIGAVIVLEENDAINDATGLDGSYRLRRVPAGTYHIRITYNGFETYREQVTLTQEAVITVNIQLHPRQIGMHEVTITAKKNGAAENTARNIERNADQVMNIISGKAIQLSPDLTVANVVQRVSGISIERNNNGDGQYAIVRGMDKRYNYTLVNGIKIPSPDNKYRYVPLDIFPSELLDRLEVYKALTPRMEGDAIGGAVNMVMKDAPAAMVLTLNLSTGYNDLFLDRDFMSYDFKEINKKSPYELNGNKYNATPSDFPVASYDYKYKRPEPNVLGGFALGNRFLKDRFGIIVAGSYQRTFRGNNSTFYDIDKVDTFHGVTLTKYNKRHYSEQQNRSGLHVKADYRFNERNKLQWYNAYINLVNIQVRDELATELTYGGYDPEAGNATLTYETRTRLTRQSILTSTLQGDHTLNDRLSLNWSAVYADARQQQPDNTTISLAGVRNNFQDRRTYVDDAYRRWEHNTDRDLAGYVNFTYLHPVAGIPIEWMAGGLYRDKRRTNFYNNYTLRPTDLKAQYGIDFNEYTEIQWTVQNPQGSVGSSLNYDASEQIAAGYLQFKVQERKLEIVGGVRAENTDQGYHMQFPIGEDRPDGEQVYLDILPSLHFKYKPWANTNLRASYFRSINRPGFFEIVPYKIVNEEYQERGNPDLRHAIADNFDIRYEVFPHAGEQLMAGIFYKQIKDPIEYTLQRDPVRGQDIFYSPGNFGTATNYGLEIDLIKYVKKFGIKANYTYTHSSITTAKSKRIRNGAGDLETISVDQTRPLYGQAAHIANLSLLFKDTRHGWDIQLAGNYTGQRIVTVSQFVDNDFWQKGFVQLDCSIEKTFRKGKWALFAKANNLLNTPMEIFMKSNYNNTDYIPEQDLSKEETLIRKDLYGRTVLLGLRWKLF